jgi:hypothetical protein
MDLYKNKIKNVILIYFKLNNYFKKTSCVPKHTLIYNSIKNSRWAENCFFLLRK